MRAQGSRQAQRVSPSRLAVAAAGVAFAGLVALPFSASVREPTEVVAGAAVASTTTTTAPPPAPVVVAAPAPTVPPQPPPAAVEAPPIVVADPATGVGAEAAPLEEAPGVVVVPVVDPALQPGPGPGAAAVAPPLHEPTGEVAAAPPPVDPGVVTHPERLWVVSIGIDDYPGSRFDLQAARADAVTVTDTMAGLGVPADHIYEVLDGAATVEGVLAAVEWLVANAGPADTAVFFYAGHVRDVGGGTQVLVTADGRWIADWFLARSFEGLRSADAWFAIAACFGGGFDELLAPGRILTAAAGPDDLAYESPRYGRSYMVQFVFQEAVAERQAPAPTVQSAVAWAEGQLVARYPDQTLWHVDDAGHVVSLDGADRNGPPPGSAPTGGPAPADPGLPAPPTTAPPPGDRCLLGLLCG